MTSIASNLQIDSARLWDTIHETAKFGATAKGGVRRLTLGPEDRQVRDWFRTACEAAGLEVHVDGLGGMFALRRFMKAVGFSTIAKPSYPEVRWTDKNRWE